MDFKNLKKKLVSGLMVGAMLLGMSGGTVVHAEGGSADSYFKKMNSAFNKVKSYNIKYSSPMDMSVTVKANEREQIQDTKSNFKLTQTVINSPKLKAKSTLTKTKEKGGQVVKNTEKTYLKTDSKGNIIVYTFLSGAKTPKKGVADASNVSSLIKLVVDTSVLSNVNVVDENYDLNGKKVIKLTAEVNCKDVPGLVSKLPVNNVGSTSDTQDLSKELDALLGDLKDSAIKFTYYIDRSTYLPVKVTADVSTFSESFMNKIMKIYLDNANSSSGEGLGISAKITINKATITMTFSGYNKTKTIKFPSSCK